MNAPAESDPPASAVDAVVAAYARRGGAGRYSMLQPDVWQSHQERQREVLRLFARLGWRELGQRRLFEVGCGAGGNLLDFLRMGFAPQHLGGVELLPERLALARRVLPSSLVLHAGDALQAQVPEGSQDVVFQSTVFSSLLDDAFQQQLATAMWRWVKPGGGVLWYDMRVDNPANPDVRGLPASRLAALFPQGRVQARRVTLAPPLARRLPAAAYPLFNALPLLRSHLFAWIQKAP